MDVSKEIQTLIKDGTLTPESAQWVLDKAECDECDRLWKSLIAETLLFENRGYVNVNEVLTFKGRRLTFCSFCGGELPNHKAAR